MQKSEKEWIGGRHPVLEALEQGQEIEAVWIANGARGPVELAIRDLCKARRISLRIVPPAALDRIWRGNHQGVLAWRAAIAFQRIEDLLPLIYEQGETPLLVLLDGITDVRNAGAIARSALAAGAHALIVGMRDVARFGQDAVKASAGALLHLPVCRETSLSDTVRYLRDSGLHLVGATLQGSVLPESCTLTDPLCLIMGAEDTGISPKLERALHQRVRIPQSDRVDSYNVSVATGILLYEVMRQRRSFC